jgi:hypothetical protein
MNECPSILYFSFPSSTFVPSPFCSGSFCLRVRGILLLLFSTVRHSWVGWLRQENERTELGRNALSD